MQKLSDNYHLNEVKGCHREKIGIRCVSFGKQTKNADRVIRFIKHSCGPCMALSSDNLKLKNNQKKSKN